jgi:hypothetical protein
MTEKRGKAFKATFIAKNLDSGPISQLVLTDSTIDVAMSKAGLTVPEDSRISYDNEDEVEWRSFIRLTFAARLHNATQTKTAKAARQSAKWLHKFATEYRRVESLPLAERQKYICAADLLEATAKQREKHAKDILRLKDADRVVLALAEIFEKLGGSVGAGSRVMVGGDFDVCNAIDGPFVRFCGAMTGDRITGEVVRNALRRSKGQTKK